MDSETFRAATEQQALEAVMHKLGPKAVVLSVRKMPSGKVWQVWKRPVVEVVAMLPAVEAAPALPAAPLSAPAAAPGPAANPALDPAAKARLQSFMEQLYNQTPAPAPAAPAPAQPATPPTTAAASLNLPPRSIEPDAFQSESPTELKIPMAARARQNSDRATIEAPSGPLTEFRDQLIYQGVDEVLVRKVIHSCAESLSPQALNDRTRLKNTLENQLQAALKPRPEDPLLNERIVCLIGLSGSGKTSTCAKLAAHSLQRPEWYDRKLTWVTADTVSAGSISEARSYTDALGLPLNVAYSPEELEAIVETDKDSDLILVDTPQCNPYKETNVVELGNFLTILPKRATYLVIPATAKDADLSRALATFRPFGLKGLVVTRLDETNTYGNVYNLAWRSQLPILYVSAGPRIPADLQLSHNRRLVSALLGAYSFGEDWVR